MVESSSNDLLILYGTQTNTAKYAAECFGRECLKREVKAKIIEFDDIDLRTLPS
jgi:flavodoxin